MRFKKPKFWDLKKPNFISKLLLPFTLPIIINNILLNFKSKKKIQNIKTICIGNIYIGGTGKTPTTIKLYKILKNMKFNVVTAKKNYTNQKDEKIILQNKTNFISDKTRKKIIKQAIYNKNDLIIFDDGLQDKNVNYDIQLVCFDFNNWIGNGCLIPAGPLREKLDSLKKYDGIFLKNTAHKDENINNLIKNYNSNIEIFNTHYEIVNLDRFSKSNKYLIFSGIGNPNDFKNILIQNNINIVDEMIFPDHYMYNEKDINLIKNTMEKSQKHLNN